MSTIPEPPPIPPPKRPVFVWIISIYFIFGLVGGVGSIAVIKSGLVSMLPPAQKQYFDSLNWFDYGTTIVISLINTVGAVMFFLLRRPAYYLFSTAFVISVIYLGYQIVARNYLSAVGVAGLEGVALSWMLILAIIFYARHLVKARVLR